MVSNAENLKIFVKAWNKWQGPVEVVVPDLACKCPLMPIQALKSVNTGKVKNKLKYSQIVIKPFWERN